MKQVVFVVVLLVSVNLFSQYQNVKINTSGSDHEEVSIAINPKNTNQVAGGANIKYFYSSSNGGAAWSQKNMTSTLGVWGDPCLLYDGMNNLYYGHLSDPMSGYWIDRIVVQKSTDNGQTWNDGAGIGYRYPKEQDKEWLGVNMSDGPYKNHLYVTWTEFDSYGSSGTSDSSRILFSRSTDQGTNWMVPVVVSDRSGNCIDEDNTVEGAVPCVGINGEIFVSWTGPLGLLFDKSTNGGLSFGQDVFVSQVPGGWDFMVPGIQRCNGLPITACDTSRSLYRGNIYIVWGDQRNGTSNTDVFFIKSTDNGTTWSGFKKVNDDNTDRHQFFPWMTIDQSTGFIYVVFYDRRGTTGSATDVYVACSQDGGTTFENIKVSQSSFTPSSGVFFGDYTNIAAVDRKIRPMWMRMDNSSLSVWTALMTDTVAVSGAPVLVSPANNAINIPQVVSCSWGQVSNATAYHLQITSDPSFNTIVYNDSMITGVTVQTPALANNTKYYWRVRAKVNSSYSMWSAVWNFSIGSNCIDVVTTSNWNLISIPLTVANPAVSTLFPNANSPAYAYNNGYQVASQLVQGQGYWLKFPGEFTNTVCGQITQPQTVSIAAGWNLIGPFHSQVSTTQLQTVPPGILNSSIYGYQGNYSLVNTLLPGKGYWIKASQAGTLSFTVTGKGSVTELAEIEKLKKITITDADGKTGTLYINDKAAKDNLWELPPVPPAEVFDVRFSSHLLAENISEPQNIQMQGFSNPVTIRTEESALDVFNTVTGKFVGKVTAGQPLTINLNNMNSLAVQQSKTAMDFSLMQNYPNPFNPSTTIGFILPQSGKITLKVYNMLGEEIVTLFEGVKEAGEHELEFDGKNMQSGMYIYRLSYGNMHVSKTMALIK